MDTGNGELGWDLFSLTVNDIAFNGDRFTRLKYLGKQVMLLIYSGAENIFTIGSLGIRMSVSGYCFEVTVHGNDTQIRVQNGNPMRDTVEQFICPDEVKKICVSHSVKQFVSIYSKLVFQFGSATSIYIVSHTMAMKFFIFFT